MSGALGRSLFVAALFVAHPLHVESLAWLSERKDLLCTLLLDAGADRVPEVRRPGQPAGPRAECWRPFSLGLLA